MISACANPACGASLDYGKGQFYRFHCDPSGATPKNSHSVWHFWLCEECSRTYILECRNGLVVFLRERLDLFPHGGQRAFSDKILIATAKE
jgi:hypothetical protein